ncbi:acyl-CoA N-acyltransferase [Lasiosphaeria miniovina]|uniref:Acyl-CoA N-acyltransferase n=1 Tax=Lasiosphaeria miniovina TaxID=1954250 RepID=A0AA40E5B6_9PEZI|nr:acyl-CoA N-acyltransferase [Lasiosphaeria miniovina]KAK0727700.1 acyl-CoA N-acyltransferase [Lasiosphaeria miniovina]
MAPQPRLQLQLRPARASDIADMVASIFSSFATNAIHTRLFPASLAASQDFWRAFAADAVDDLRAHCIVAEDLTAASPSAFVGFALWRPPADTTKEEEEKEDPPFDWTAWPVDSELAAAFFGALADRHAALMGARPHWYLEFACVTPALQRRGAGAALVRWGVDRADADGVEAYLDATPDGTRLYERFGFCTAEVVEFMGGEYRQCFMPRPKRETETKTERGANGM